MNYKQVYVNLIESRRGRQKEVSVQYERHHINPRCFGGSNRKENIVYLTYREHFIAHRLLVKFTTGKRKGKMVYALCRLCTINNESQQYRIKYSRQFSKIKQQSYKLLCGENNHNFGRKFSKEEKERISKRMKGKNNPFYGKPPWNKGKTKFTDDTLKRKGQQHSEKFKNGLIDITNIGKKTIEGRKRISEAQKGKPKTEEHKKKLSKTLTGRKLSTEIRKNMSKAKKGVSHKIVKCPYCEKEGGYRAMYRWHFENCKQRINNER